MRDDTLRNVKGLIISQGLRVAEDDTRGLPNRGSDAWGREPST